MATNGYVGINNVARKISKGYVGISTSYTPVEYIESSGTQYIDTGYYPSQKTRVQCQFAFTDIDGGEGYQTVFCGRDAYKSKEFSCVLRKSDKIWLNGYGSNSAWATTLPAAATNTLYTIDKNNNIQSINNQSTTIASETFTSPNPLLLFINNTFAEGSIGKLYNFKIYDDGTLTKDFIPAIDQDNVACLYEQVEGKLYYNKGTGTFTAGSTTGQPVLLGSVARKITKGYVGVHKIYIPIEYIESSGTQYIDTSFVPSFSDGFKIEIGFNPSALNNRFCLVSNYNETTHISCEITANNEARLYINGGSVDIKQSGVILGSNTAIFEYSSGVCKVTCNGNTTTSSTTFSGSTVGGLYMFVDRELRFSTFSTPISIDYCKMYSNNTLVRDFVPVLDDNNVACLYDKVDGKAYYNKGTGTFTAGSETSEPPIERDVARLCFGSYTPLNYIESTGTQWIDTGVVYGYNVTLEFDYAFTNTSQNNYLSGVVSVPAQSSVNYYFLQANSGMLNCSTTSNRWQSIAYLDTNRHTFIYNNSGHQLLYNGSVVSGLYTKNFDANYSTPIFGARNGATSVFQIPNARIYSFKATNMTTNEVICNMIPVLDSDGVPCMYDLITEMFRHNQGTGTFLYG